MNEILQKRIEEAARDIAELCPDCDLHCKGTNPCIPKILYQKLIEISIFVLQNQWISVEEALPECDKCHLAMYEDGGIIVAKYKNETWWWQDGYVVGRNTDGDFMYSSSCKVPSGLITHWAPIPSLEGGGE